MIWLLKDRFLSSLEKRYLRPNITHAVRVLLIHWRALNQFSWQLQRNFRWAGMDLLCYKLERKRMGTAVIINNLNTEQPPTRKDVESMSGVFRDIGNHNYQLDIQVMSQWLKLNCRIWCWNLHRLDWQTDEWSQAKVHGWKQTQRFKLFHPPDHWVLSSFIGN